MSNQKQLTFPWSKPNKSSFSEFYFDQSNLAVKDALLADVDLFLYGINQTGKSFLLQSACNYFASIEKSSLYIPVKEVKNITEIIKHEMTSVTESDLHTFSTPLTVDVNTGDNWGILH